MVEFRICLTIQVHATRTFAIPKIKYNPKPFYFIETLTYIAWTESGEVERTIFISNFNIETEFNQICSG